MDMAHVQLPARLPPAGPAGGTRPVVHDGLRQPDPDRWRRLWRRWTPSYARELVLVATLFCGYKFGRLLSAGHVSEAFGNAWQVWSVERLLHLPSELAFQHWALQWPEMVELANAYYAWVHFPVTALLLVWLWWRDRGWYRWIRTILAVMTAVALVVHIALPLAPPRMMSPLGFVDTGVAFGQSIYASPSVATTANEFAAMPSLHVGWAMVVALAVVMVARSPMRWLAVAHPAATVAVVVITANHYWLDGIAAVALLVLALLLALRSRPWRARPGHPPTVDRTTDVPDPVVLAGNAG
jgi:hypothetical protein